MSTLPPIAETMRKKGMSTKDIIVALCGAKAAISLKSVMVVDVKAARIKDTLDSLGQTLDKQVQKSAQSIQEGIDLISNNRPTAALGSALTTKMTEVNQKIQALADEQTSRKKQCRELMAGFQSAIAKANPADTKSAKEKLDALEKSTEKLSNQLKTIKRELDAFTGEVERTLIASNLSKARPSASANLSENTPRNDEDTGPS